MFFFQVMADPQVTIGYHRFQQHDLNGTMTWMIRPQFGVIFLGTTVLRLELHPGLDSMFLFIHHEDPQFVMLVIISMYNIYYLFRYIICAYYNS